MVHSSLSTIDKHVHSHVDIFTWSDISFRDGIDVNALRISVAQMLRFILIEVYEQYSDEIIYYINLSLSMLIFCVTMQVSCEW
jgi:hypothetical protein